MDNERDKALTLEILQAVDDKSDVTQRHLASKMGIALGLANSYLKRCVRKGHIKITQAPANRYLYYLTPKGFAEKSKLTSEYLTISFDFYREASESIASALRDANQSGFRKITFIGVSELAEIGLVRAYDFDIDIIGTLSTGGATKSEFLGKPVWGHIDEVGTCDAVIITYLNQIDGYFEELQKYFSGERLIVPSIVASIVR